MKGILIYQPTSKSAPLADFIDGLDPRLREKILLRLYFLTQLEKPEMKEPHFKRWRSTPYLQPHRITASRFSSASISCLPARDCARPAATETVS